MQNEIINSIRKTLNKEANSEEEQTLKQWLALSEENEKIYKEFQEIWEATQTIDAKSKLLDPDVSIAWQNVYQAIRKKPKKKFKISKIAATLALLILSATLSYILFYPAKKQSLIVSEGKIDSIRFNDGSMVYLHGPSKLSYPKQFGRENRSVRMEGNILFKVAKDAKRPFIVKTDKGSVTVLGTSFVVNTLEEKKFSVHCISGKVSVRAKGPNASYTTILKATEKTTYTAGDTGINKATFDGSIFSNFGKSELRFKQTAMPQVIKRIEKYYALRIAVENKDLLSCTYTSSFQNLSAEEVMEELALAFQCKLIQESDSKYKLMGGLCN